MKTLWDVEPLQPRSVQLIAPPALSWQDCNQDHPKYHCRQMCRRSCSSRESDQRGWGNGNYWCLKSQIWLASEISLESWGQWNWRNSPVQLLLDIKCDTSVSKSVSHLVDNVVNPFQCDNEWSRDIVAVALCSCSFQSSWIFWKFWIWISLYILMAACLLWLFFSKESQQEPNSHQLVFSFIYLFAKYLNIKTTICYK